jgi:hypothetical protein
MQDSTCKAAIRVGCARTGLSRVVLALGSWPLAQALPGGWQQRPGNPTFLLQARRGGQEACEGDLKKEEKNGKTKKRAEDAQRPLRRFSLLWVQPFILPLWMPRASRNCRASVRMLLTVALLGASLSQDALAAALVPAGGWPVDFRLGAAFFVAHSAIDSLRVQVQAQVQVQVQSHGDVLSNRWRRVQYRMSKSTRRRESRRKGQTVVSESGSPGEAAVIDLVRICPRKLDWRVRSSNYYIVLPTSMFRLATNHSPPWSIRHLQRRVLPTRIHAPRYISDAVFVTLARVPK